MQLKIDLPKAALPKTPRSQINSDEEPSARSGPPRPRTLFCLLNDLSELGILTTFYLAKNGHRWVTCIARGPVRKDVDDRLQGHRRA